MLPILTLDIAKLCHIGNGAFLGRPNLPVGQTFAYRVTPLRAALEERNESLDNYLTAATLKAVRRKFIRGSLLFFFSPANEMFFVTGCDHRLKVSFEWLTDIAGYFESGQELVHDNAMPFLLWENSRLIRLHADTEGLERGHFVSDFGTLFGLSIGKVSAGTYRDVSLNPGKHWELSPVPVSPRQTIRVDGEEADVHHSRWTLA